MMEKLEVIKGSLHGLEAKISAFVDHKEMDSSNTMLVSI